MRKGLKSSVALLLLAFLSMVMSSCSTDRSSQQGPKTDAPDKALSGLSTADRGWSFTAGRKTPEKMVHEGNEILLADSTGKLLAVDISDGSRRIAVTLSGPVMGWDKQGNLVVTGTIRKLVHLNDITTGEELWSTSCGTTPGEPAFTGDGVIFVEGLGPYRVRHHSINDGIPIWLREFDSKPSGYAPVVGEDAVFIAFEDRYIRAFGLDDGQTIWDFKVGPPLELDPDGRQGKRYEFLDEAGVQRARLIPTHPGGIGRMLLIEQGLVIPSEDGYLRCLNQNTGEVIWELGFGDRIIHAWLLDDAHFYCDSIEGDFYRIDPDGGEIITQVTLENPTHGFVATENSLIIDLTDGGKPIWRSSNDLEAKGPLDVDIIPTGNIYSNEGVFVVRTNDGRIVDLYSEVFH